MLGGSLNGGKIKGTFPKLSSDSDHWLTRGRIIPTMPWESVWNGVAQWFHVHEDEDLDFAMPNRKNFETCSLFTDTDLFVDGVCQCTNGATVCDEITYPPTTVTPSYSPTTDSPTAELPTDGTLVKTIFPPGSTVEDFGCNDGSRPERVVDGTTVQYDWVIPATTRGRLMSSLSHLIMVCLPLPRDYVFILELLVNIVNQSPMCSRDVLPLRIPGQRLHQESCLGFLHHFRIILLGCLSTRRTRMVIRTIRLQQLNFHLRIRHISSIDSPSLSFEVEPTVH